MSSQTSKKSDGEIQTAQEYSTVLAEAEKLATPVLKKADVGETLNSQELQDIAQAEIKFDRLSKFRPSNNGPYFMSGRIAFARGDNAKAIEKLQLCLSNTPSNPAPGYEKVMNSMAGDCHFMIANIKLNQGQFAAAEQEANFALERIPGSSGYLTVRARALIEQRKLKEAKADLEQAVKADANNSQAKSLLKFISSDSR